ncbi:MAG: hypothetical protein ACLPQS_03825 [Acidimicrobiales bacterium]
MRVLVVGSLPPPVTDRARGLLAEVLRRRAEGAAVEVLSPTDYSVAHAYLEMPGPASAVEIALAARGADAVVVQLQPGFPFDEGAGRAGRAIGLGALTTALRSVKGEVTVRLHSIHDLPHGVGGRAAEALWAVASNIEVGDEETRSRLLTLVGDAVKDKISLAVAPLQIGNLLDPGSDLGGDATLDIVTATVRARAAAERRSVLADPVDAAGRVHAQPRVALWEWSPHPGAGVPDWGSAAALSPPSGSVVTRAARAALYAAESRALTRPLARGARIARRLARQV